MGELFRRRRPYRRRIVLRYRLECLVAHSRKWDKPDALFEPKLRQFLLVFEGVEFFFDQALVGAPFTGQHVVVNVIADLIVEQKQRICRCQDHRWFGVLEGAFQFEIGVLACMDPSAVAAAIRTFGFLS